MGRDDSAFSMHTAYDCWHRAVFGYLLSVLLSEQFAILSHRVYEHVQGYRKRVLHFLCHLPNHPPNHLMSMHVSMAGIWTFFQSNTGPYTCQSNNPPPESHVFGESMRTLAMELFKCVNQFSCIFLFLCIMLSPYTLCSSFAVMSTMRSWRAM